MKKLKLFRNFFSMIISLSLILSTMPSVVKADVIRASEPLGANVAYNSRVIIMDIDDTSAHKLVDGDLNTSLQVESNSPKADDPLYDPQEWIFQFDEEHTIDTIELYWEDACAKEYNIYVSDTGEDDSWSKVATETDGKAGTMRHSFQAVKVQYIKLQLKYRSLTYGYNLYELMAFTPGSTVEKDTENLALKAKAFASATDGENVASRAIDGRKDTMWQSPKTGSENTRANEYIQLQWDSAIQFDTVKVRWGGGYMSGYKIQISDNGDEFTDVAQVYDGIGNEYREIKLDKPYTAKYLRLQGIVFGAYCFEIKELEVYDESTIEPEEIYLSRDNLKLKLNSETTNHEQLEAAINPSNSYNKDLLWESSNSSVATVDENGLVNAVGIGKATITASSKVNPNIKKECNVTVAKGLDKPDMKTELTEQKDGIIISWNGVNDVKEYVLYRSVVDGEKVEIYRGTSTSVMDSNLEKKSYIYYLTAIAKDDEYLCDSETVVSEQIKIPRRVTAVDIINDTKDIYVGNQSYVTANVSPGDATDTKVKWTSSDSSICSVDSNGKIVGLKEGTVTITATSNDNPQAYDYIVVNVKPNLMEKLVLDRVEDILQVGNEIKLYTTIYPSNTTYKELVWSSSDEKVATVDENGIVKVVGQGNAIISVYAKKQPEIKTTYTLTARVDAIKIEISDKKVVLNPGYAKILTAKVYPSDATDKKINWKSSNRYVADVEANGRVVAFKTGTTVITAYADNGKVMATCTVYVQNPVKVTKPAKVVMKKLRKKGNKVTIRWKKAKEAWGYEIFMKKGNGKYKKIKTIKKANKLKFIKKKLKKNKKYTFKIRAYKMNNNKKVYGLFSKIKKITL